MEAAKNSFLSDFTKTFWDMQLKKDKSTLNWRKIYGSQECSNLRPEIFMKSSLNLLQCTLLEQMLLETAKQMPAKLRFIKGARTHLIQQFVQVVNYRLTEQNSSVSRFDLNSRLKESQRQITLTLDLSLTLNTWLIMTLLDLNWRTTFWQIRW